MIHVAKYLGASIQSKPKEDEQELEELLDLLSARLEECSC